MLRKMITEPDSPIGKRFNTFIQTLIVLSLISFTLSTDPNLSAATHSALFVVEVIITILFTIEYLARIYYAPNRLRFIFSFYGLIDLIAILPFYVGAAVDLRSFRVFRLLRALRTLKLIRYNQAMHRFYRAFAEVRDELILFMVITGFVLYLSSVGIYYFENHAQPDKYRSLFDCLWWSVATLTTVGYGDIYPITTGGRLFTFIILMVGLGVIAVPSGLIASALTRTVSSDERTARENPEAKEPQSPA